MFHQQNLILDALGRLPRLLTSFLLENYIKTLILIALLKELHPNCCIQHHLQLPICGAACKPILMEHMKKVWVDFAKKYMHWTSEYWRKGMWSDESTLKSIQDHSARVRWPSSISRFNLANTVGIVMHSESVMIWGWFSGFKGQGSLYFLPKNETMNSDGLHSVFWRPSPSLIWVSWLHRFHACWPHSQGQENYQMAHWL